MDDPFGRTAERCKEISQGDAFFAYPWYCRCTKDRTPAGVLGVLDTRSGHGGAARKASHLISLYSDFCIPPPGRHR